MIELQKWRTANACQSAGEGIYDFCETSESAQLIVIVF